MLVGRSGFELLISRFVVRVPGGSPTFPQQLEAKLGEGLSRRRRDHGSSQSFRVVGLLAAVSLSAMGLLAAQGSTPPGSGGAGLQPNGQFLLVHDLFPVRGVELGAVYQPLQESLESCPRVSCAVPR